MIFAHNSDQNSLYNDNV